MKIMNMNSKNDIAITSESEPLSPQKVRGVTSESDTNTNTSQRLQQILPNNNILTNDENRSSKKSKEEIIEDNFELVWKMLPSTANDRKKGSMILYKNELNVNKCFKLQYIEITLELWYYIFAFKNTKN